MSPFTLGFYELDQEKRMVAGGKGANLGELSRIRGIRVPEGFCVSIEAYERALEATPSIGELLDELSLLKAEDRIRIAEISARIRSLIEGTALPDDIEEAIARQLSELGDEHAYAVRSSATAEDLPTASFAGQHDTYLNIIGRPAILDHLRKCWASLFTERAVAYRIQHGVDHREVQLAVVVQRMVFPQAAGILFTADPVTGNRRVASIDAGFGLGEALVSGLVNADVYKVRDGRVIDRKVATKKLAIHALEDGGTQEQEIAPDQQHRQVLTDEQILELSHLGRTIEGRFGQPQDIEWCLVDGTFQFLQSRPITTLYPVPVEGDDEPHVYVSVGHQQMMTDPMKPLGWSFFQLTAPRRMAVAGGRLFVDIAPELASPARDVIVDVLGKSDPLIRDALRHVLTRADFLGPEPVGGPTPGSGNADKGTLAGGFQTLNDYGPEVVTELIESSQASIAELKREIQSRSGEGLFDFITEDIRTSRQVRGDSASLAVIMTAMNAAAWINEHIQEWLDEKNVADTLAQSVPHNITSEMGLALLDVADAVREHPDVLDYLNRAKGDSSLADLEIREGGKAVRGALDAFLDRYGMRCAGEIDITRTRWREKPGILVPLILGNLRNFHPGASRRKFEQGRQEALEKERQILARLRELPDGEQKAGETKRMIDLVRNLSGYREYPKYGIVSRYFVYKQALLREAERLVRANVIRDVDDIYFLTFQELREVVRTHELDDRLIEQRKDEHRAFEKLTPPRVMTSEGEIFTGEYRRENLPAGALAGLPVSSGVVEGRARVILDLEEAELEEGDILVTTFTDPSWTPLFVSVKGLVTEVGGLMTHGAVIAREYGLPAVVGVEHATRRIKDGQRIRLHGTEGYVELL